ncbi:MAG: SDR family oxidoreductase [Candidatus Eremiobacteraeota bacterium]|nr:SDR family oxidoreductase [Candidatus Eremiobacteraeota bacterium]
MNKPRLLVTGASGHLGRLVIEHLRRLDPSADVTAMVRTPRAADELAPFRVATRIGDYTDPTSLDAAVTGIDRLLLISSSVLGQRAAHHKNLIEAATRASVSFIAYTSILRADTSELSLAAEHLATEEMLRKTRLPFVVLRNGWYLENDTAMLAPALAHGAIIGSAGDGGLSSASRSNYAEAAALVLVHGAPAGTIYELAGDQAFTLTQLAAEVSRRTGKAVGYRNMSEAEYRSALLGMGLPDAMATMLAQTSAATAKGALEDHGHVLSRLIGHQTTSLADAVAAAV